MHTEDTSSIDKAYGEVMLHQLRQRYRHMNWILDSAQNITGAFGKAPVAVGSLGGGLVVCVSCSRRDLATYSATVRDNKQDLKLLLVSGTYYSIPSAVEDLLGKMSQALDRGDERLGQGFRNHLSKNLQKPPKIRAAKPPESNTRRVVDGNGNVVGHVIAVDVGKVLDKNLPAREDMDCITMKGKHDCKRCKAVRCAQHQYAPWRLQEQQRIKELNALDRARQMPPGYQYP